MKWHKHVFQYIVREAKDFWDLRNLEPRAHNALLTVVSILRLFATIGIAVRLIPFRLPDTIDFGTIFALVSFVYAFYVCTLRMNNPSIFFSTKSKEVQIVLDVVMYSTAQFLSQDIQSDLFFLNILPFLIVTEFFSFAHAIRVSIAMLSIHLIILFFISTLYDNYPTDWFIKVFLPRSYVMITIGSAYVAHRRLRNPSQIVLDQQRERFILQLREISRDKKFQKRLSKLDQDLRDYLANVDWYRHMVTRIEKAHRDLVERNPFKLLLELEQASTENTADFKLAIERVMHQLGTALDCSAGTFRIEALNTNEGSYLHLYGAFGCANHYHGATFQKLDLDSECMVTTAFKTGEIQKWVKGQPKNGLAVFHNIEFAHNCNIQAAISLPVAIDDQKAVYTLYRDKPLEFTEPDRVFIESVVDYLVTVIVARRNHQRTLNLSKQREQKIKVLSVLSSKLSSFTNSQDLLQYVVDVVHREFKSEATAIFLLRGDRLKRKVTAGIEHRWFAEEQYIVGQSMTGKAFENEDILLSNDVPNDGRILADNYRLYRDTLKSRQFKHLLAVQLRGHKGGLGVIRLINKLTVDNFIDSTGFTDADADLLITISSITAITLETIQQVERNRILLDVARTMIGRNSVQEILKVICRNVLTALNADQCGIVLIQDDGETGVVHEKLENANSVCIGNNADSVLSKYRIIDLKNYEAAQRVIETRKPLKMPDAQNDPLTATVREMLLVQNVVSMLLVPLIVDGKVIGTLGIDSIDQRREFLSDEVEICELICVMGSLAIDLARRFERASADGRALERSRIRKDLHDLRGLLGSNILVDLQKMEDCLSIGDYHKIPQFLREALTKGGFIIHQIGFVMEDLRQPILYEEGLSAAIDHHVNFWWGKKHPVEFESNLRRRIDSTVEHELYRIAQEAIANACRHGIANISTGYVKVILNDCGDRIELTVTDNGCGFDNSKSTSGSLGLISMRERAKDIGTELHIASSIGKGTCVSVSPKLDFLGNLNL